MTNLNVYDRRRWYGTRVSECGVLLIIGFFAYTLVNKLLQFDAFKLNLARTGIFEARMVDLVAYFAVTMEAASILLLVFSRKWGLRFALLMMVAFTLYILYLATTGHYEVCGCGGVLNGLKFQWHLLINLVLIFILLLYVLYHRTYRPFYKEK